MKKSLFALVFCILSYSTHAQELLSQRKIDRSFKSGMELLGRNEYGAARNAFEEFLSRSSSDDLRRSDASYYQALCALSLLHGDGEKLMEQYASANLVNPHAATASYELGNFYYNGKNYGKANDFYGKTDFSSLSSDQQTIGHFRWGYSLFTQRKLKEALDQFNSVKTLGGTYGPAGSYYAGFIEFSQGEYALSQTDLFRAEKNPAYARIVPYLIASGYYKQKQYDDLLQYVSNLKEPETVSNKIELALLTSEGYFRKDDFKNALTGYQQYLSDHSNGDKGVLSRAGYAAYAMGNDNLALGYFKSSASDQDSVGFYSSYYLGSLYLKQNLKPQALTAFDNARKFKADTRIAEEATFQYAKISYDLGRSDQAISEMERFLKVYVLSAHAVEVKELLSQAYVNANNYNKAIEYIESLPSRGPNIERAYQKATFLKASDLFNRNDYPQAVALFQRSLEFPIEQNYTAEASFWCAEAYAIGKKYDQAVPLYERILVLKNYDNTEIIARTRYGVGYARYNQQQYDKALVHFREFVNMSSKGSPLFSDGVLRLADCYYVGKSYAEALTNYRKAIALSSPDADYAHLQSGVILGSQRKYDEADAELDQLIRRFPQSRYLDESIFERAQFDFEQGNYDQAVVQFTKIIATDKPSRFLPYAYQRRAAANYNLKQYSKTAEDYMTLIDRFPSHPVVEGLVLPLQESLSLANRSSEFDQYLTKIKKANPDAKGIESIEFEAAKNSYFNQEYKQAIISLTNYLSAYPESPRMAEAQYFRAESMYKLNDLVVAQKAFQEIRLDNTFSFATRVMGRLAELEFKQGNYQAALPHFRRLAKAATSKKDQYNAWAGLMEVHYLLAQYDSADAYAKMILEKAKVNAGAENKASLFLGKDAMARGDYESAKDEFLSTLNNARDEFGAEAKYLLGEIFYLNKDYKQCYETLISLNADFAGYTDWVGKSFLLLADNYVAMGETFQAKGTLNSLIENFPKPLVKEKAKEKLKLLEVAEQKKQDQQLEKDSISNNKKN